jgi:hypothetical protein
MQKLLWFILPFFIIYFTACSEKKNNAVSANNSTQTENIFPVTEFLKGQLRIIDSMGVTPLKIISANGRTDSIWLKREDIRKNAIPFLTPVIDSASMYSLFSEKSFLDQTINAFTFSYDPKKKLPGSIKITHWDVYMNPETNSIDRIYIVKENDDTTKQLTWVVNKWYSIRTIIQPPNAQSWIKEEKMIWDFEDR